MTGQNELSMTKDEFINFVNNNVRGVTFVTFEAECNADKEMNKRGNPFYGKNMVKKMTINGAIGYIYGNAINRQADREGLEHRDPKIHPWGDMDEKHLFRTHRETGNKYLSLEVKNTTVHGYFIDGNKVEIEQIKPFIKEKGESSTQSDFQKKVIVRDFAISSIMKVRMKGVEINITQAQDIEAMIQPTEIHRETIEQ